MKRNETANYTVAALEQTTEPSQCDINNFTESIELIWKRYIKCSQCAQLQSKTKLAKKETTKGVSNFHEVVTLSASKAVFKVHVTQTPP